MVIMFQIIGEVSEMLLIFAIICKSSLYLWGYWLPVAMEGPTPVSSLLHSSTIVVAGVYLMILISVHVNHILLVVLLLSLNIIRHFDVKKNIAYSTSIHLLIILILGVMRMYHAVIVYIMLHRIVKGQVFQKSGYRIHAIRSQDMRVYTVNGSYYLMCIGIFILSAILGMVIVGAKELVVLGGLSVSMLFLVVVSYMYTLQYINKVIMRE
jgi:NADH-ubiquinone oxidoreductase chain 5